MRACVRFDGRNVRVCICKTVFCYEYGLEYVRARGVKTQMRRGWCQGQGQSRETLFTGGRDGAGRVGVRGREREEKTERDPRRGVTLPNHQDGGKARSGCRGSSDRSEQDLCCAHKPRPLSE